MGRDNGCLDRPRRDTAAVDCEPIAAEASERESGHPTQDFIVASGIQIISATLMDEWREVANC
ncbi:hypothetical protein C2U48_29765 (plasmid) [Escherichia coli]|uniref:Uncharacterized protein n=2 Tax=Enterobacteriaceae TaxID=543 RepID=A0A2I8SVS7_ECOLX|nr:hypothetical protein C2U48_29765 [Escherichia coli]AUW08090.1 hypothetical protein C2U42_01920 [Klebsiella oxytoca]AUZ72844.1 hypothetical protein C2U41_26600 [Citrobacter freundii complex sp. CFNIH4]EAM5718663.1 hypothetical protein [Salmonella enterica]EIW8833683.1 hypothetical protein [Klebsiella pneumoniae]POU06116.1 hypothetical protein C3368_25960 [Citrobacter freundii complex sp. CFNIH7]POU08522.1 hypothetical protein C3381_26010 [Citrobacter freundii complex sp. CFNIH6]POU39254.1 